MESTPGASPPSGEGYEFTTSENKVIRSIGLRARIWAVLSLIAGVLAVRIVGPLLSGGGAFGGALGIIYLLLVLIPIFIALSFDKAGRVLAAMVSTEGSGIDPLMGAIQNLSTAFLLQIVAAVSWVVILLVFAVSNIGHTREEAYLRAQMSDFRNLAQLQERFFRDNEDGDGVSEYAGSMAALSDFVTSDGVSISIIEASEFGWAATSTHAALAGPGCAIYVGSVTPPTAVGGTVPEEEGRPACDR